MSPVLSKLKGGLLWRGAVLVKTGAVALLRKAPPTRPPPGVAWAHYHPVLALPLFVASLTSLCLLVFVRFRCSYDGYDDEEEEETKEGAAGATLAGCSTTACSVKRRRSSGVAAEASRVHGNRYSGLDKTMSRSSFLFSVHTSPCSGLDVPGLHVCFVMTTMSAYPRSSERCDLATVSAFPSPRAVVKRGPVLSYITPLY